MAIGWASAGQPTYRDERPWRLKIGCSSNIRPIDGAHDRTMELIDLDMLALIAGFGFSLLIMWSGVGAGVLVIPTLVSGFGVDPLVAIATGSLFAFVAKLAMTLNHTKGGTIDWPACGRFLSWCLPVTVGASGLMAYLSSGQRLILLDLSLICAIWLAGVLSLGAMLIKRWGRVIASVPMQGLSVSTGVLMGLTGVGGGILVVPALVTSGGLAVRTAVATSIPIGLILSLAVSITLGSGGLIAWQLAISMLIGCALALPIGSKLFNAFSEKTIRVITCTLIAIALFDLLIEAIGLYAQLPTAR